jgi:hypothetical protein
MILTMQDANFMHQSMYYYSHNSVLINNKVDAYNKLLQILHVFVGDLIV